MRGTYSLLLLRKKMQGYRPGINNQTKREKLTAWEQ
jgi:hypothetical protein